MTAGVELATGLAREQMISRQPRWRWLGVSCSIGVDRPGRRLAGGPGRRDGRPGGRGGLDVLINNAGIQISRHSDERSSDDFDKVLAVNIRGAFLCAREAIKHFLAEGKPLIINVSSVHQLIPKPDYLGYSVSKGGMQNLTRARVRRARNPRQRDRPGRDRDPDQSRVDR